MTLHSGTGAPHLHDTNSSNMMRARRMRIDTYQEPVIYMRSDCHICKSEGFEAKSRIEVGDGLAMARHALDSGAAWKKFEAICEAQGGLREPPVAAHTHVVPASRSGRIDAIDNRRLSRIAKLAGAPQAPAAGLLLHCMVGTRMDAGQPLYTIHAASPGELAYARSYAEANVDTVQIREEN